MWVDGCEGRTQRAAPIRLATSTPSTLDLRRNFLCSRRLAVGWGAGGMAGAQRGGVGAVGAAAVGGRPRWGPPSVAAFASLAAAQSAAPQPPNEPLLPRKWPHCPATPSPSAPLAPHCPQTGLQYPRIYATWYDGKLCADHL